MTPGSRSIDSPGGRRKEQKKGTQLFSAVRGHRLFVFLAPRDVRNDRERTAVNLQRRLIMSTTLANTLTPVLADYVYVGGGLLTLVIVVLVIVFLARRI